MTNNTTKYINQDHDFYIYPRSYNDEVNLFFVKRVVPKQAGVVVDDLARLVKAAGRAARVVVEPEVIIVLVLHTLAALEQRAALS